MLSNQTPFPYPGSYALLVDPDAPAPQPNELVRINWRREGWAMVSFPLRDGASGNKVVAFADLIDATPLSAEETREFHELDRGLGGRDPRNFSKGQRARAARRDALRRRIVHAPLLERRMRDMRALHARQRKAA
jgi:hypothetical protein